MRILSVEDDPIQAQWICETIEAEFADATVECIATEQEFYAKLDAIASHPPDLILLDVMLRWTNPAPNIEPPPSEVREGGFFRAGLRCERLLAARESTRRVPVILYTVLDRSDLEETVGASVAQVSFLRKEADPQPLVAAVRAAIGLP